MSKLMPYQAIITKYIGPTNTRGSRIKATAAAGSITIPNDSSLGIPDNHAAAARKLAEKFGWKGRYHGGGLPDDAGYVFVCTDGGTDDRTMAWDTLPWNTMAWDILP